VTVHASEPLLTQRPRGPLSGIYAGNARAVIGRGMHVMRRNNLTVVVSGFFEPIFYLLSMGIGLGSLIGVLEYRGVEVPYAAYIAPALMAVSASSWTIPSSGAASSSARKYASGWTRKICSVAPRAACSHNSI
jgi:lipooligosaccharide transport system permease protein